jgi:excisionase family DNA binding protein
LSSVIFVACQPSCLIEFIQMEKDLLTIDELREYLSCSRAWVYVLMREHKLPHAKIGKRVYFKKADIDRLIESKMVK